MARIVVTPAEEEDEVIVAGGDAPAPEPARVTPPSPEPSPASPPRETTLDDLESSPMPLAQKVVIVAAIVCIIGALVYYFVAMR